MYNLLTQFSRTIMIKNEKLITITIHIIACVLTVIIILSTNSHYKDFHPVW